MITAGCGKVGVDIANKLSDHGLNVTVIDKNMVTFSKLNWNMRMIQVMVDATDVNVLQECGIEHTSMMNHFHMSTAPGHRRI